MLWNQNFQILHISIFELYWGKVHWSLECQNVFPQSEAEFLIDKAAPRNETLREKRFIMIRKGLPRIRWTTRNNSRRLMVYTNRKHNETNNIHYERGTEWTLLAEIADSKHARIKIRILRSFIIIHWKNTLNIQMCSSKNWILAKMISRARLQAQELLTYLTSSNLATSNTNFNSKFLQIYFIGHEWLGSGSALRSFYSPIVLTTSMQIWYIKKSCNDNRKKWLKQNFKNKYFI